MPDINDWTNDIHCGDAKQILRQMPADSIHMAMCSPPYYGLRDYGVDGQIGLEETLDEYIDRLVSVGDELRRVLRPDGSWWLNLGDSYGGARGNHVGGDDVGGAPEDSYHSRGATELGAKNKMLVPHRTVIALQEAGWIVRNDAVWAKPNPMPESVTDRLSTTFEFVFHLTPNANYWYDLDAIREPHKESSIKRDSYAYDGDPMGGRYEMPDEDRDGTPDESFLNPKGKNPGDVFRISTEPYPDAHFAVYPPELCRKPIKATCPPKTCTECDTPYKRDIETPDRDYERGNEEWRTESAHNTNPQRDHDDDWNYKAKFKGWKPRCDCDTQETQPGITLDPFTGAGTTLLVAKQLNRRFIGIDLNPEYVAMAQARIGVTVDEPKLITDEQQTTLQELPQN